jgi:glucan phosphoethanolaminetransferase (alkaline phosphatase superfamily)
MRCKYSSCWRFTHCCFFLTLYTKHCFFSNLFLRNKSNYGYSVNTRLTYLLLFIYILLSVLYTFFNITCIIIIIIIIFYCNFYVLVPTYKHKTSLNMFWQYWQNSYNKIVAIYLVLPYYTYIVFFRVTFFLFQFCWYLTVFNYCYNNSVVKYFFIRLKHFNLWLAHIHTPQLLNCAILYETKCHYHVHLILFKV